MYIKIAIGSCSLVVLWMASVMKANGKQEPCLPFAFIRTWAFVCQVLARTSSIVLILNLVQLAVAAVALAALVVYYNCIYHANIHTQRGRYPFPSAQLPVRSFPKTPEQPKIQTQTQTQAAARAWGWGFGGCLVWRGGGGWGNRR